jgi:hypothetical protein
MKWTKINENTNVISILLEWLLKYNVKHKMTKENPFVGPCTFFSRQNNGSLKPF